MNSFYKICFIVQYFLEKFNVNNTVILPYRVVLHAFDYYKVNSYQKPFYDSD